jgi:hypothetical protein
MAGLAESGPIAVALHVRSDAAVLEASIGLPDDPALLDIVDGFAGEGAGRILDSLPSDTWFAFGVPQLGRAVSGLVASIEGASPTVGSDELSEAFESQTGLDLQEDVLSWMGSTGLFVQGTIVRDLGGALVIESSDADKTDAVVARIREAVDSEDPTSAQDFEAGGLTGFSVALPPPAAPIFVMGGDRAVIAYGERALNDALAPASTLGDSDQFSQAIDGLGDGYEPTFYFDLTAIPKLVQAFTVFGGDPGPSYESDVKPVLESLDYAVVGSKREDETLLQRFVIGVQDGEE